MKLGFFVNILFFLLSCGGKQQGGIPVHSVDVLQRDSVNHFFSGYEYVMLETNENCLLGEVKGMKVYDSVIGIRERERILLFGHDGKFISKIDKKGRGAGEYLSVEDFCVRDSLVYVLSGAYKSILVYGMSGTFVRKIELGDWYGHFEVLDDELMFLSSEYNNEKRYNFVVFNYVKQEDAAVFSPFETNEGVAFGDFLPFCGTYDNGRYAILPFDCTYTVYQLDKSGFTSHCRFEFNTEDRLEEGMPLFDLYQRTSGRDVVRYLGLYEECNGSIYVTFELFTTKGGIGTFVYKVGSDKKSYLMRLQEKHIPTYPYVSSPYGVSKGSFYSIVEPSTIMYIENQYGLSLFRDKGLTEESNPVVFFHKLK